MSRFHDPPPTLPPYKPPPLPLPCRYVKFDTFFPAVSRGLPVTRVISRLKLQEILYTATLKYGGTIRQDSHVVDVVEDVDPVSGQARAGVVLDNGSRAYGDLVIGAALPPLRCQPPACLPLPRYPEHRA